MVRAALIHQMNVPIDDIDRAREFYGGVPGLPAIKRHWFERQRASSEAS